MSALILAMSWSMDLVVVAGVAVGVDLDCDWASGEREVIASRVVRRRGRGRMGLFG